MFVFAACREERVEVKGANSLLDLKMHAREAALEKWETFLEKANLEEVPVSLEKVGKDSFSSPCHCSYQVIGVNLHHPAGYPNVDLDFYSPLACDPMDPAACTYFFGSYNSFFPDCVTDLYPGCVDHWAFLPPPDGPIYAFNCDVDRFSSFPVSFGAIALDAENCLTWDFFQETNSILFKIYCQESQDECGGFGYVSAPMVLSFNGSGAYYANGVVSLTGDCGCEPVFSD